MIYFVEAVGVGNIKIGFTDNGDAEVRLASLSTGSPVPLRLLGTIPGTMEDEKNLHRRFAAARVCGEWFKPVPELVALIPSNRPPGCGAVEVTEKTISIRVLTVGRKQFSRSLLDQLPEKDVIRWWDIFEWVEDEMLRGESPEINLAGEIGSADIWGFVVGGTSDLWCPSLNAEVDCSFKWIIYANKGALYKCKDYLGMGAQLFIKVRECERSKANDIRAACNGIYSMRLNLPRWTDQLFIGV